MSRDKRYPAFLLIIAVFLGFFLVTANPFHEDPPQEEMNRGAVLTAAPVNTGLKPVNTTPSTKTTLPVFPIDINRATVRELMLLPGIGEKTARRIMEKRAELDGFRTVDDLTAVKWIGKVKLEKIRGLVTVSGPSKGQGQSGR